MSERYSFYYYPTALHKVMEYITKIPIKKMSHVRFYWLADVINQPLKMFLRELSIIKISRIDIATVVEVDPNYRELLDTLIQCSTDKAVSRLTQHEYEKMSKLFYIPTIEFLRRLDNNDKIIEFKKSYFKKPLTVPKVEDFVCGKLINDKMCGVSVGMIAALWQKNNPMFRVYVFTEGTMTDIDLSRSVNVANPPYLTFDKMKEYGYLGKLRIITLTPADHDDFMENNDCALLRAELGISMVIAVNKKN